MNYLDEIAVDILRLIEPKAPLREDDLPLYRIYAVLALAKGENTTVEDVHNAWVAWITTQNPSHPSAVPFSMLSQWVQSLDRPYVDAIHAVAKRHDACDPEAITYDPMGGTSLDAATKQAVALAAEYHQTVLLRFNGIDLFATAETNPADLVAVYTKAIQLQLTSVLATPEGKRQQQEIDEARAHYAADAADPLPSITLRDADAWRSYQISSISAYSQEVMRYAQRFAGLVEQLLARGDTFDGAMVIVPELANTENISGAQAWAAWRILKRCWIHGDALAAYPLSERSIGWTTDRD